MEFIISSHLSYAWKKEHLTTVLEELLWNLNVAQWKH